MEIKDYFLEVHHILLYNLNNSREEVALIFVNGVIIQDSIVFEQKAVMIYDTPLEVKVEIEIFIDEKDFGEVIRICYIRVVKDLVYFSV